MNREIYEARLNGEPVKKLSEKYGISNNAINTIVRREERKERLKDQRFYHILVSLTEDEELLTRTLNVLERNNIDSDETIMGVTKEQLLRYRNCGKATTELILKTVKLLRDN